MTTPDHLRYFRSHFALTQQQAADFLGVKKRTWWRWEQSYDPIPDRMLSRLQRHAKTLTERLAWRDKFCSYCGKSVEKAKKSGGKTCPYCTTRFARQYKLRVAEALPPVFRG